MSLRLLILPCSSWWDHVSTRKAAAVRRIRVAKEIRSFMEEGGVVASQLKPYSPGARLVPSIHHGEEAERAAWGAGHLCPPAGPPAPHQVPGVLDVRPAGAGMGTASGRGAALSGGQLLAARPQSPASVGVAAGARAARSTPRHHGWRLRVGAPRSQLSQLLPRVAPAWCARALRRGSCPSLGRAGRWGPDGFLPAPDWSPTRAAAA